MSVCAVAVSAAPVTGRVVLISIDGLRPDAIEAASAPTLEALIGMGAYHPQALCALPAWTLPNHATMVTGLAPAEHGVIANWALPGFIDSQTIFDMAHASGLRTAFFASKDKLGFLARPESLDVRVIEPDIALLTEAVIEALSGGDLDLVLIHYREPDSTGHAEGWMSEAYLAAVAFVDQQLQRVISALDDAGLLGETYVLVTADHGGLGNSHFWNIPEVRLVPWILVGPDVPAGRILCEPIAQADTAVTALGLAGGEVPEGLSGRFVAEARRAEAPDECAPSHAPLGLPCVILVIGPVGGVWWVLRWLSRAG